MIRLENVSKEYKNGVHALRDINLTIEDGEFVYIIGPTGSGKSTLIKLLDGEEIPNSGTVMVENINVGKYRFCIGSYRNEKSRYSTPCAGSARTGFLTG